MQGRPSFANWLSKTNNITQTFLSAGQIPGLINLGGGLPDPATWPVDELARLAESSVRTFTTQSLAYAPIEGMGGLRDFLAQRYSTSTLHLTRENVLITSGGMQALNLLGDVFLNRGDIIAAQSPAYLGALDAWRFHHPIYRPMHLEDTHFDPVSALHGAKFGYVVPNFSNPTGRMVCLEERLRLIQATESTGTWLIEDDPYGALQYDGTALPRLLALTSDQPGAYSGTVIHLGSLSKELVPGLRVGWVIAPVDVIRALVLAKQGSDLSTSGLSQCIALQALSSGLVDQNISGAVQLYRKRRDALCDALSQELGDLFYWDVPAGGMFIWATARTEKLNTDDLLPVALSHGVCIAPSSVFDPMGLNKSALRLNFTLNSEERLFEGVRRLARATRSILGG